MNGRIIGLLALILLVALITNLNATSTNPIAKTEQCYDYINNDLPGGHPGIDCGDYSFGGTVRTCSAAEFHPDSCPDGRAPVCLWDQLNYVNNRYVTNFNDYDGIYKAGWKCSSVSIPKPAPDEEINVEPGYSDTLETISNDGTTYGGVENENSLSGNLGVGSSTSGATSGTDYVSSGTSGSSSDSSTQSSSEKSQEIATGLTYDSTGYGTGENVNSGADAYAYDESGYNSQPRYYNQPQPAFPICGDGICSYGEACFSDCGYSNTYYNYGYFDYYYDTNYGYDYCYVNSPTYAYVGDATPIQVVYYGYTPYSVQVDCGDGGSAIAYRNSLYSNNGVMYAYCRYTYEGIFFPQAFAQGTVCYSDSVIVRGRSGGGGGNGGNGGGNVGSEYVSLNYPTGGETLRSGNSITIDWASSGIDYFKVFYSKNGGSSWNTIRGGQYRSNSVGWTVPAGPTSGLRIKVEGYNDNNALVAYDESGDITVRSGTISPSPSASPSPTVYPTPSPVAGIPSCAITAFPGAVVEEDSSIVTVNYYELARSPNAISIDCGNGKTVNAVSCYGTSGSCSEFCNYENKGTFHPKALIGGVVCSQATVTVTESSSEKCSDGTSFGACSISKPKYCDDGILVDRAGICGCESGLAVSGNRCVSPTGSCRVSVNPSIVRANSQTDISIDYEGIALGSASAQVICGNGQTQVADCESTDSLSGSCTSICAYGEESAYPKTLKVSAKVKGIACSTANVQITAPSDTVGTLLAKVSSCETGQALTHAKIKIENNPDYYTDSNGQLKISLEPDTYTITASKSGFNQQSASTVLRAGKISTSEICLNTEGCSISAELIRVPEIDDSNPVLLYQIRVTNNLNSENEVALAYSSAFDVEGEQLIVLGPGEARVVDVLIRGERAVVGRSFGMVSISGEGNCVKNIELPIKIVGGLSLELQQNLKETFSNDKVCFDFLVRNRGSNEGTVTLKYEGDLDGQFNVDSFFLTGNEIRDGLQFCADVPSGETDSHTIRLRALSPISDALGLVTVKVLDTGDFGTDFEDGCIVINDNAEMFPITIDNDVADGDYAVTLRDNEANVRVTPSMLYNFKKGSARTVYINADPDNFDFGDSMVQLILKKDGDVAMQRDICIASYDGHFNRRQVYSQLSSATINVPRGGSASTTLTIRNSGTIRDDYFIRVQTSLTTSISESSFALDPDEEKKITIKVSAKSDESAKRYSIPIKIYSGRGSGGVYYNTQVYDSANTGGSANGNTAFVKCGNGKTVALNCDEGSSSCTAVCRYTDTGSYTIEGNIGNTQCRAGKERVIPEGSKGCAIATESMIRKDSTVTVRVKYNKLNNEPSNEQILVLCGNGDTDTADNCDGTSGTCQATCEYSGTGTFTINANAAGEVCTPAEIKVTDESSFCSITASGLAEEDDSVNVNLKYRDVYFGGQFFPYNYGDEMDGYYDTNGNFHAYDGNYNGNGYNGNGYYDSSGGYHSGSVYSGSGILLKTENLVAIVAGGSSSATIEPGDLSPDAINVKRVVAAELPTTGRANVAMTFKNLRDYKIKDILLLVDGLPAGVSLRQVAPFELDASSERTIYFQLEATGAKEGNYKPRVRLKFDSSEVVEEFDLRIGLENEIIKADAEIIGITYEERDGNGIAKVEFSVTNKEGRPLQVSAIFRDLPDNWSAEIEPALGVIKAGESLNFSANVTAIGYEQRSYTALLELRSPDGRRYSTPIVFEFQKLGLFSGLFAFFGSLGLFQVLIILAVVALIAFAYIQSNKKDEDGVKEDTVVFGEQASSNHLKNIGDEVGVSEKKQTTLLDVKKFKRKGAGRGGAYEATEEIDSPAFIEMDLADVNDEDALKTGFKEDGEEDE
ncbi:MAG: carboxypeptidase-like regulatory domain-containing protein [Candidatus Micrarchaeota archaeon]